MQSGWVAMLRGYRRRELNGIHENATLLDPISVGAPAIGVNGYVQVYVRLTCDGSDGRDSR